MGGKTTSTLQEKMMTEYPHMVMIYVSVACACR